LAEYGTVEKLTALLMQDTVISSASPLVKMHDGAGGRPLFLIHTGRGGVTAYGLLTRRLRDRPIYGLQSVGLQGESWPLMSVPAMARRYLPEILAADPTGPYLLAGACMGGLVALELAQLLRAQNRPVGLVALLDVLHPMQSGQRQGWREKIYCPLRDNLRDALRIARWSILRISGGSRSARGLAEYRRFVANMNFLASRFYQLKPYAGTLTLLIAAGENHPEPDRRLLLRRYALDSIVHRIPADHTGFYIKPGVDALARQLQACLEAAEK
jgi:thioesterase domain-containing protein